MSLLTAMIAVGSLWFVGSSEDRFGIAGGLAFAYFDPPHVADFTIAPINPRCPWPDRLATLAGLPRIELAGGRVEYIEIPLWLPAMVSAVLGVWLWRTSRSSRPGHCGNCGYNLTGNVSGRCPECGAATETTTLTSTTSTPSWRS